MKINNMFQIEAKIKKYGYEYSFKKFLLQLLLFNIFIGILAFYFRLTIPCLIIVFITTLFCFPLIVLSQFKYLYQNKRYEYVVGYLEQMIFAFKKTPKILDALKTTLDLVDPSIRSLLEDAIVLIETDNEGHGYDLAFSYIEASFPSSRVQAMHAFFLSVEKNGGKYQYAIDILLDDIHKWVSRTYRYQKELQSMKAKIILSVILSFLVAGTMTFMVPEDLVVLHENSIYLFSTTCLFVSLIIMVSFVFGKLHGTWLVNDQMDSQEEMKRTAQLVDDFSIKKALKSATVMSVLLLPIFFYAIYFKEINYFLLGFVLMILIYCYVFLSQQTRKKKIVRNIQKSFPLWLRDISLQVQTLVVPLAIEESIAKSPYVLQGPLQEMIVQIREEPDSITPYRSFLQEYQITDVQNAMSMLYSVQTLPMREIQIQITALIKRNQEMLEKSETMNNEDKLAGVGLLMAIPMLLATFKLMADLTIILLSFLSLTSGM